MRYVLLFALAWGASPPAAAAADPVLEILGTPHAHEPITGRVRHKDCQQLDAVRYEEGLFRIYMGGTLCTIPIEGRFPQAFTLGQLPAGNYRAQVVERTSTGLRNVSEVVNFEVAAGPAPNLDDYRGLYDEGGIWWNSELLPGEAFFVDHATVSDQVYMVWNTYLPDGTRDWRIIICEPPRYGDRNCKVFTSADGKMTLVGTALLESRSHFNWDDRMTLRFPIGDHTRVIPLFPFVVR